MINFQGKQVARRLYTCVSRTPWIRELRSFEFTCWFPVADVTSCTSTARFIRMLSFTLQLHHIKQVHKSAL